jgi:nucleotide-binding universal stress UspA family protein
MDRLELWGSELLEHPPQDITKVREFARERLHNLTKAEEGACPRLNSVVVEGTPYREIVKFAEHTNADLIILNVQSKSVLERAMLGATAERVIRSSTVPVLSIPVPN